MNEFPKEIAGETSKYVFVRLGENDTGLYEYHGDPERRLYKDNPLIPFKFDENGELSSLNV